MFVFVFGIWWAYFDDVPRAGIRAEPVRTAVWLVGHLVLQLGLVAGAVGYAKVLGYELGTTLVGDKSLLLTLPLAGVLVGMTLIGIGTRRAPQRPLVSLRLGVAALLGVMAVVTWQVEWISADGGAAIIAATALATAAAETLLLRRTRIAALHDGGEPTSMP
jgi:low temperature requirement protein LtrA